MKYICLLKQRAVSNVLVLRCLAADNLQNSCSNFFFYTYKNNVACKEFLEFLLASDIARLCVSVSLVQGYKGMESTSQD